MRNVVMVVLVLLLGCNDQVSPPDASPIVVEETCDPPIGAHVDFLGEACDEAPFPAVTTCHGDDGWCVDGTCRPQCNATGCRRCDEGSPVFTDRGACYCTP